MNSMEPSGGFLKSKPELSRHPALRACSPYGNNTLHDAVRKQVNSASAQREDILPNTNSVITKTFPQALKVPGQGPPSYCWDVCSGGQAHAAMAACFSGLSQQRTADARE